MSQNKLFHRRIHLITSLTVFNHRTIDSFGKNITSHVIYIRNGITVTISFTCQLFQCIVGVTYPTTIGRLNAGDITCFVVLFLLYTYSVIFARQRKAPIKRSTLFVWLMMKLQARPCQHEELSSVFQSKTGENSTSPIRL